MSDAVIPWDGSRTALKPLLDVLACVGIEIIERDSSDFLLADGPQHYLSIAIPHTNDGLYLAILNNKAAFRHSVNSHCRSLSEIAEWLHETIQNQEILYA